MSDYAQRVSDIERWWKGNGKPGAAAVIVDHETRLQRIEARTEEQERQLRDIEVHHAGEEMVIRKAIREEMKERSHTLEGMIRMMGPYVAAASAIVVALISNGSI